MDGLGLADHEHWGMSIKSTQLVLDYSETLKRSRLNEEASVARRFHPLDWREWQGHIGRMVLADCGFGFDFTLTKAARLLAVPFDQNGHSTTTIN